MTANTELEGYLSPMLTRWSVRLVSLALLCLAPSLAQRTGAARLPPATATMRAAADHQHEVAEHARTAGLSAALRDARSAGTAEWRAPSHGLPGALARSIHVAHRAPAPSPAHASTAPAPGARRAYDAMAPPGVMELV
jgi:hypothetical protein